MRQRSGTGACSCPCKFEGAQGIYAYIYTHIEIWFRVLGLGIRVGRLQGALKDSLDSWGQDEFLDTSTQSIQWGNSEFSETLFFPNFREMPFYLFNVLTFATRSYTTSSRICLLKVSDGFWIFIQGCAGSSRNMSAVYVSMIRKCRGASENFVTGWRSFAPTPLAAALWERQPPVMELQHHHTAADLRESCPEFRRSRLSTIFWSES